MERSQVTLKSDRVPIEPKILQVLLVLAKHQGEVVPYQTILEQAWQGLEVGPNTIQRCITKLRKVLGDDAKEQRIIATYPKVGYSLLANVNWPDSNESETHTRSYRWHLAAVLAFGLLTMVAVKLFTESVPPLPIAQLVSLTTTDNTELSPTFSPDGRYVAFQRYTGMCESQIWAKDLTTRQEFQLTKNSSQFGTPSWSPDGKRLAFSSNTGCADGKKAKKCKDIQLLSFPLAKGEPRNSEQLVACDKESYGAAIWLSDDQVAFLAKAGEAYFLKRYTLSSGHLETLSDELDHVPYSLEFSNKKKQFLIAQHDMNDRSILTILSETGKPVQDLLLEDIELRARKRYWTPAWHPSGEYMITSWENRFYRIDMAGNITRYPVASNQEIYNAVFDASGEKIVASVGTFDSDIGEYALNFDFLNSVSEKKITANDPEIKIIHRSTVVEQSAKYQPGGDQIAFISDRNGEPQIWLSAKDEQGSPIVVADTAGVESFIWSNNGQMLLYLVEGGIQLTNLDGASEKVAADFFVTRLYHQVSENEVLLGVNIDKVPQLILFNLATKQYRTQYLGRAAWAYLDQSDNLLINSWEGELFQIEDGEKVSLVGINPSLSISKFFLTGDSFLLFDSEKRLWRYHRDSGEAQEVGKVASDIIDIGDIDLKANKLLVTRYVGGRKEIVVFYE